METGHYPDRRSAERFLVSLPVETDRGPGITRDVSVRGLYLLTEDRLVAGDRLRLVLTLPDHDRGPPLRLSLKGRVIRAEDVNGAVGIGIALEEESPRLLQTF